MIDHRKNSRSSYLPMKFHNLAAVLLLLPSIAVAAVDLMDPAVGDAAFPMVADGRAAPICIPPQAAEVVRIAARDLAADVERITGQRPEIRETLPERGPSIRVTLAPNGADHWETFRLSATADTLTIQGSDKRGLAFGIYDLSRRIGVSPWHWWADVPVTKRSGIHLSAGSGPLGAPAVKYRGIFLNDEGWGLVPWAAKTFEPEAGPVRLKPACRNEKFRHERTAGKDGGVADFTAKNLYRPKGRQCPLLGR
jgi:hypothetical protein